MKIRIPRRRRSISTRLTVWAVELVALLMTYDLLTDHTVHISWSVVVLGFIILALVVAFVGWASRTGHYVAPVGEAPVYIDPAEET